MSLGRSKLRQPPAPAGNHVSGGCRTWDRDEVRATSPAGTGGYRRVLDVGQDEGSAGYLVRPPTPL